MRVSCAVLSSTIYLLVKPDYALKQEHTPMLKYIDAYFHNPRI